LINTVYRPLYLNDFFCLEQSERIYNLSKLPSSMKCNSTTSKGERCRNSARLDGHLCTLHFNRAGKVAIPNRINEISQPKGYCTANTALGEPCKNTEKTLGLGKCWRHSSISTSLCTQVILTGANSRRCRNICQAGSISSLCYLHTNDRVQNDIPALEIDPSPPRSSNMWMPEIKNDVEIVRVKFTQCCALDYTENEEIVKCSKKPTRSSLEGKYCSDHTYKYRLPRDDCPVCLSSIDQTKESPLACGHWFHNNCLKGWKKPTCPTCRADMTTEEKKRYCTLEDHTLVYKHLACYGLLFQRLGDLLEHPENLSPRLASNVAQVLHSNRALRAIINTMRDPNMNFLTTLITTLPPPRQI